MTFKLAPFHPVLRPILSEVFPHRLNYTFCRPASLQRRLLLARGQARSPVLFGSKSFASLSGRDRMRPGSGQGARAGSAKSLIEDEADLSDWVSGLNSNSFKKTRVYSDSDDDGGGKEGRGFKGGEGAGKRRREGEFDRGSDFSGRQRGGGRGRGRGGNEAFSGRRNNVSDSGASSFGGREGDRGSSEFRRGGKFGGPSDANRRGGRFGGQSDVRRESNNGGFSRGNEGWREKRESGGGSEMGYRNGRGRGGNRGGLASNRGGRGMERRGPAVTDDDDMEEEDDVKDRGYTSRGRVGGRGRGGFPTNRGGRGVKRSSLVTDEDDIDEDEDEDEDKGFTSFKELIDSDEEDDDSDEEDSDIEEEEEDVRADSGKERISSQFPQSSPQESASYLSESRFDQCPISALSLKGIKDAGYEKMTLVQEATLPVILKGKDVLAKAKTGTGKTVAFLLPSIEIVAKSPPIGRDEKRPPISVLIICPTRELATQAAAEGNKLLKYHPSIGVQVVIGGTRLTLEQKRMQANACQILVATPGRLRDHIENTSGFATRLMGVKVLVLDEADHLLDMGFRKDIEKIIAAVPKQRQTLLFSATIPPQVRQICHIALKRDHEYINTVEEGSEDTHSQVRQTHLVVPLDKHFSLLYTLLKDHIADDVNYKVLVFCTTAMVTKLVAELLSELNLNVREIHSRKPQSYRTRVSDEFRKSTGLILVTSDVSARGVDYPDVTLVVQIGVPADKQQYIHRLGRTGRKGKEGQGILMLAPWEEYFLANIKDLPISKAPEPVVDPETRKKVERALSHVEMKSKESAYQAWLGYYNSNRNVGKDKCRLVELANEFSRSMGLDNPPAIAKLVLGKMGLKNVPGLRSK